MPDLFETFTPANVIHTAVRNMAAINWNMPLDRTNFAIMLDKGMVEIDIMVLAKFKPFKTLAFVQNELTTEIYNLVIETRPLEGSKLSVLCVKQISYGDYEKARKNMGNSKSFEGGNPFIKTDDYMKRRVNSKTNDCTND